MPIHEELARGRWRTLTLAEQLGNIGSEISRANHWAERSQKALSQRAFERALELFDLTLDDPRWSKRLRELCRAREAVCDFYVGDNQYGSTAKSLQRYFDQFAILARLQR